MKPGGALLFRSFEASIEEAPFDRNLLLSREDVLKELGSEITIHRADVADEYFAYLKKEMRLLTVVGSLPEVPD